MQRLEVSGVVRPIYRSLGVKRFVREYNFHTTERALIDERYMKPTYLEKFL